MLRTATAVVAVAVFVFAAREARDAREVAVLQLAYDVFVRRGRGLDDAAQVLQRGVGGADAGLPLLAAVRVVLAQAQHADQQRKREALDDQRREDHAERQEDDHPALRERLAR